MSKVPLGEVAEFINGRAFKPSEWVSSGLPIIRIQNLTNDEAAFNYSDKEVEAKYYVKDGDLLVSWSATLDVFIWNRGDAILNQHIFKVVPDASKISKKFLFYALKHIMDELRAQTHGATMKHITRKPFEQTKIYLPPIPEQERIVRLLDEAESLRAARLRANARMEQFVPALFQEMFGDLTLNDKKWKIGRIFDLCEKIIDCPHATPVHSETETEYASVRSSDIQNGRLDFSTTKYVGYDEYVKRIARGTPTAGDVIYCREGARFGNAALIPEGLTKKICLGQRMMLFRVDSQKASPEFLWATLESAYIRTQAGNKAGGSASPHVNVNDIKNFSTIIPPLPLQHEFTERVGQARAIQSAQERAGERLEALYQSMLSRAFAGEL